MKYFFTAIAVTCFLGTIKAQDRQAPAYPLITHDPYFSIWSFSDAVNESTTKHWTGKDQSLIGMIKVDGTTYRFLGSEATQYNPILPSVEEVAYRAKITESKPEDGWNFNDFDDSQWNNAEGPFGNGNNAVTKWKSKDLWYRRNFDLKELNPNDLYLKLSHDDDVEVYINGDIVYECKECWTNEYNYHEIPATVINKLKKENNLLAIHVKNNTGGQFLDAGIVQPKTIEVEATTAKQTTLNISATQTEYGFVCGGIDVSVSFTSPLLMDDLDLLSRPVSYVSIKTVSNDGKAHDVQVFFGASSALAVNEANQKVISEKSHTDQLIFLKAGTEAQPILEKKGDNLRIDWGYMYIAAPRETNVVMNVTSMEQSKINFMKNTETGLLNSGTQLMLNAIFPKEKVTTEKDHLILVGYDDIYSIQYFGTNLRPWWNHEGKNNIENELDKAFLEYDTVLEKCNDFDKKLRKEAISLGGEKYAKLCEIGYRQSIAAHKLVKGPEGEILFLSKENFSNGCINTVDVTYPSAPLYLIYNPDLMKGMLNGIFYYSESGRYNEPFPAHDLGTYPLANGVVYGEPMPVEESGNMIILTAAIVKAEGDAEYAKKHWESLTTWANYLADKGFDPGNQLCTDDFAGHLARNANLSVKAIVALGCYGYLANQLGYKSIGSKYIAMAKSMAIKWMDLADGGDHYALTFDDKNTWSQKYNLVWDKILHLDLFPKQVYDREIAFYFKKQNKYGLPLDSRSDYTKSDWVIWTATLTDSKANFEKLINPIYSFAVETKDRIPMSDWHFTSSGDVRGFRARSVVGGYFIRLLEVEFEK